MLLNLLLVFTICYFIKITETYHLTTNSNTKYAVAKNREELINIIRSLKYHQDEHNNVDKPDVDLNDEEKEKKLQNILWLLNKNYNAQKHFEHLYNNGLHKSSRLYLIKNPLVLEEYKNHLKKFRRFSKINSKKNMDQQNNLKNKLRNMRRDAIFRLGSSESYSDGIDKKEENTVKGSSESYSDGIDKKEENKVKGRNGIQEHSYSPIPQTQEKEDIQDLKKEVFENYSELRDTLELHNTNVHHTVRSDNDFRREKSKWDERHENVDTAEEGRKKKHTYRNQPTLKKNRFSIETVNWDKITTKDNPIKYKKKITLKESEYKIKPDKTEFKIKPDKAAYKINFDKAEYMIKPDKAEYKIKNSYNRHKNDNMNKEFHSYGRTSIPFVGKRGIYDEK